MRKMSASLALGLLLPALLFAQRKQSPEQKPVAFTHVTVIDTTGALQKADMTVVIAGDRIVALDNQREANSPGGRARDRCDG